MSTSLSAELFWAKDFCVISKHRSKQVQKRIETPVELAASILVLWERNMQKQFRSKVPGKQETVDTIEIDFAWQKQR